MNTPMDHNPKVNERSEISDDLPDSMERRLVLRLLKYWRQLQNDGDFVSFDQIEPEKIPGIWPNCFVVEIFENGDVPILRVIGEEIAKWSDSLTADMPINQIPPDCLVGISLSHLDEVVRKGVPVSRGGEYISHAGGKILYRSILIPMSDDGKRITGLLGAANCRETEE
jgi:hypothetical protein